MDWYPHHIIDYRRDTLHLSTLEHGAYRLLIDAYMELGELPDSDPALAKITGMHLQQWTDIAPTIRAFFRPANGHLTHKRCDAELVKQAEWRAANNARQTARRLRRKGLHLVTRD